MPLPGIQRREERAGAAREAAGSAGSRAHHRTRSAVSRVPLLERSDGLCQDDIYNIKILCAKRIVFFLFLMLAINTMVL